eukprot:CAMPEP_0183353538 /NCGR_PEP_ID=MMETSP0164_2-20130417/33580_1 /TAXON_ID=221442 /ORGANISM="Coccolithus pelagicus ssp braarudi, Strain PLY182g" /LENGTH=137 /DNA_ID=CAMNT_0025526221 /DNA_START=62 /DNA_END=472 /DNA_ORIENTATION=+
MTARSVPQASPDQWTEEYPAPSSEGSAQACQHVATAAAEKGPHTARIPAQDRKHVEPSVPPGCSLPAISPQCQVLPEVLAVPLLPHPAQSRLLQRAPHLIGAHPTYPPSFHGHGLSASLPQRARPVASNEHAALSVW